MVALRRVDARNGGPVSVDSAVAGATYDLVRQAATSWLSRARLRREHERLSPLQAQMKEIRRTYAGNREEEQKALMEFYKTNRMSPFPGCAWAFVPGLVAQLLSLMCSRQRRTFRDRVTRTVVIFDPCSTATVERTGSGRRRWHLRRREASAPPA